MTECSETLFPFEAHFSRQVVAQFEGGWLTTEGGSLQRIYGLALGYEDLNDHEQLRQDPLLGVCVFLPRLKPHA